MIVIGPVMEAWLYILLLTAKILTLYKNICVLSKLSELSEESELWDSLVRMLLCDLIEDKRGISEVRL